MNKIFSLKNQEQISQTKYITVDKFKYKKKKELYEVSEIKPKN